MLIKLLCLFFIVTGTYMLSALILIYTPLFYEEIGVESTLAKSVTAQFIDYLKSPSFDVPQIIPLTDKENSHLLDVKIIIYRLELALALLAAVLLICRKHLTRKVLLAGGIITLVLPVLLVIVPFDRLFTQFHYVFFPQGNWQFDPASTTLVNIYPAEFFQSFLIRILLHSWIAAAGIILSAYMLGNRFFIPAKV